MTAAFKQIPPLRKGDLVLIVAPAGAVSREDLDFAIQFLISKGYRYEISKNCLNLHSFGYNYSGTIEMRLADMQWALDHPDAKMIWAARGGYGTVHLIDKLHFDGFKKSPKWLVGYSDITVLLQNLILLGFPVVHGVTAKQFPEGNTTSSYDELFQLLEGGKMFYSFPHHDFNRAGEAKGQLVGGNLSMLYSLLGSKTLVYPRGKILFLEDWREDYYAIDRMLMALLRAEFFEGVEGIIVGGFSRLENEKENSHFMEDFDPVAYEIISERLSSVECPKAFGLTAGHIPHHLPLLMGAEVELIVSETHSQVHVID